MALTIPQLFFQMHVLFIEDALLSNRLNKNLLSFRDVLRKRYHLDIVNEQNKKCLYITSYKMGLKTIHEKPEAFAMSLYCVTIQDINPMLSCLEDW